VSEPAPIRAVPVRRPGRWLSAVAVTVVVAWVGVGMARALDLRTVAEFQFNRVVLEGLRTTVVIAVVAQGVGIVLGVVCAVMRMSRNPVTSTVARAYIWFFRGTPVYVQLLFWYNAVPLAFRTFSVGVPFTGITFYERPMVEFMTSFMAALLGLGLNEGAYMAEIVRAGIISVDPGQVEAAHALGMTPGLTLRRVVLPQAMRVIIPPTGNELISMLKTSSLASVVLLGELTRRARDIYTANLKTLELLVVVSIWYLVLTTVASFGQYHLERRFARGAAVGPPEPFLGRLRRNLARVRP
jgi:polar amino acid transport system permease protein